MDYRALAEQLVDLQTGLHQIPASRYLFALGQGTFFALNYLATHREVAYPKELSRNMAVSSARIAALLNHMEKQGLITRAADPEDNRQVVVSLTRQGEALIREKRAEAVEAIAETLEQLGPEDAEAYLRIQYKIIRNFMNRA